MRRALKLVGQITPHKDVAAVRAMARGEVIRINLETLGRAVCVRLAPVLGVRRAVADRRVSENARDDAGEKKREAADGQDEVAGGEARGQRRRGRSGNDGRRSSERGLRHGGSELRSTLNVRRESGGTGGQKGNGELHCVKYLRLMHVSPSTDARQAIARDGSDRGAKRGTRVRARTSIRQ